MSHGSAAVPGMHCPTFEMPWPMSEHVHAAPPPGHVAETESPFVHEPVHAHEPFEPPLHAFVWQLGRGVVELMVVLAPAPVPVPVPAPPEPCAPCPVDAFGVSTTTFPPQAANMTIKRKKKRFIGRIHTKTRARRTGR